MNISSNLKNEISVKICENRNEIPNGKNMEIIFGIAKYKAYHYHL